MKLLDGWVTVDESPPLFRVSRGLEYDGPVEVKSKLSFEQRRQLIRGQMRNAPDVMVRQNAYEVDRCIESIKILDMLCGNERITISGGSNIQRMVTY